MKATQRFRPGLERLEARTVLSGVSIRHVAIVGNGAAVQTASNPQSGGGNTIVDMLRGRATDLGPFQGAINYTIGPNGGPLTGTGVLIGLHKYQLVFILSGSIQPAAPGATTTQVDFTFNVTGGTKKYSFATGSGQITGNQTLQTLRFSFRIAGLVNRPH